MLKVEVFFKLAKLDFKATYLGDGASAPKGELPYIKDGDFVLDDSEAIIDYVTYQYNLTVDAAVSDEQKVWGRFLAIDLGQTLYPIMLYSRLLDDSGFAVMKRDVFEPAGFSNETMSKVREKFRNKLTAQGIASYTAAEVYEQGVAYLERLYTLLAGKSYLFSDAPSRYDAALYAFVKNIYSVPVPCELSRYKPDFFQAYCDRIEAKLS